MQSHGLVQSKKENLISNRIWIRWSALTQSERVVCVLIALTPLWWLWGWSYLSVLLAPSLLAYEFYKKREFGLSSPSLIVIALFLLGFYDIFGTYLYGTINDINLGIKDITGPLDSWLAPALTIWYVQSKKIRVRPAVVAWAFSVLVLCMLALWLIVHFVLGQADYSPSRSLFGFLTGKSAVYVPGSGNSNYLIPYRPLDSSLPGFVRYAFFFRNPEAASLVVGFSCFLALDIKPRKWSAFLFISSFFLLLLTGTRSTWLAFLLILMLLGLIKLSQFMGKHFIYALIALVSFISLSLPPITNLAFDTVADTGESISEFRGDSTEVRSEIYRRTWDRILKSSNTNFLFGFFVPGEPVFPGYPPSKVGTHSYYLGGLLYIRGVIGTIIFLLYWVALVRWFYRTKRGRPLSCLLVYLLFTVTFIVMYWEETVMPLILVTIVTHYPMNQLKGVRHVKVFSK